MKSRRFKGPLYIIEMYLPHLENYHFYGGFGFHGVNHENIYSSPSYKIGNGFYYLSLLEEYDTNLIYGADKVY